MQRHGSALLAAASALVLGSQLVCQSAKPDGAPLDTSTPILAARARSGDAPREHRTDSTTGLTQRASAGRGLQQVEDGQWLGFGRDYKALFGRNSVEFTPALGARVPSNLPWRFEMRSAGRATAVAATKAAEMAVFGDAVHYQRGDVVETYEVRADGLKQSFVFTALPAGRGDLVVRGTVATALGAGEVGADGMAFTAGENGGVKIGAVVGIDGAGRRTAGAMRYSAGELEFSLPADFVDQAVLPLVVDPLVGTLVTIGSTFDDEQPDIAWDATAANWLVVWRRIFSGTDSDIRAQRLDVLGALAGLAVAVESNSATLATAPKVANVNGANGFVIAYTYGGDVFARGVPASSGTLTPEVGVATGSNNQNSPDVGGESVEAAGNAAYVVWRDSTTTSIGLRPVTYNPNNTLTLGATQAVSSTFVDSDPVISQSGGVAGNWMIAWTRDFSGDFDIRARVWRRNGTFAAGFFPVDSTASDTTQAAVDGDGSNWVIAYARNEAASPADRDIDARTMLLNGTAVAVGAAITVEGDLTDDETAPAVGWTGGSVLVSHLDESTGHYDTYVDSLDPFQCLDCEGNFILDVTSATTEGAVQIGTVFSGGTVTSGGAAIVWHSIDTATSIGDIDFRRFTASDGSQTNLGGGCGAGGTAHATCGISPNTNFTLRLRGAPANGAGFCVLGFSTLNYACGGCVLVADPYTGLITTTTTDAAGNATQALPVPANVAGATLILQWLVPGTGCFTSFDFSNALRVTVQ